MATFRIAETIVIKGTVKDEDGVLVTPATDTKITVTSPVGFAVVDGLGVAFDSVGIFRHTFALLPIGIPSVDPVLGAYHVRVEANDGGRKSFFDSQFFLTD